jgi:hypothetical protein
MATAKRKAKGHAILASRKEIIKNEPIVTQDNYTSELNSALTWYSEHFNEKQLLKFALEHFVVTANKPAVLAINKASDSEIRQLAIMCRLADREQYISDKHKQFITDTAESLIKKYKVVKEKKVVADAVPSNVISIQQRMEEKARELAGEIEGAIDDFITSKGKTTFSTKNYLLANSVAAPIAKRIGELFVKTSNELHEAIAGEDEQLVEGYSNFTKRELKKFAEFVDSIIADCQQQVQTAKASRAPRKRKAASPTKVVSKMKFMREFAELGLKSCKPEDILSSTELWVYNTKYRKVQVYKADMGTLSVKGTTVIGFSIKDSQSMTLRKPEEFFKGLSMGKRALNGAIKNLTTKPTKPNGRINEECILLGAF